MIDGKCRFKLDKYHAEMLWTHIEEVSKRTRKYKTVDWHLWEADIGHSMFTYDTISCKFTTINPYMEVTIETHYRRKYDFRNIKLDLDYESPIIKLLKLRRH